MDFGMSKVRGDTGKTVWKNCVEIVQKICEPSEKIIKKKDVKQ